MESWPNSQQRKEEAISAQLSFTLHLYEMNINLL